MKHFIQDHNTMWMAVYYNIEQGNPGVNVNIMIYSSPNTEFNPIAEIGCVNTSFGYSVQILKMSCELKTANKIIEFLNDETNWKP